MKKICIFLTSAAILFCLCPAALAAGSVAYDGVARDFVFGPGGTESPTDLFGNFKGVMPGDEVIDSIEISGVPNANTEILLYMCSDGVKLETRDHFLSQLTLDVRGADNRTVFYGTLEKATKWIFLGTYHKGDLERLSMRLSVPIHLENEYQNALGTIGWRFLAVEHPLGKDTTDPTNPTYRPGKGELPKTGDPFPLQLCIAVLLVSGTGLALLCRKKQKNNF